MNVDEIVSQVFRLYEAHGRTEYIGEEISIVQHCVQCATCAENDKASDLVTKVILAAFLHDIGHLLGLDENIPPMITNGRNLGTQNHDVIGGEFLKNLGFPSLVCEIVAGHVNAKRYLVHKNKDYYERLDKNIPPMITKGHNLGTQNPELSETSKQTLEHQGGIMTSLEANAFEKSAGFDAIVRMRSWDERAKDTSVTEPGSLEKYKRICAKVLTEQANSSSQLNHRD